MNRLAILIAGFSLFSCQEEIVLDLPTESERLVINATVTDTSGYQQVRIDRTVDYYAEDRTTNPVSDATVILGDGDNFDTLRYNQEMQVYFTSSFFAEPGLTYTIDIYDGDNHYQGSEKMVESVSVDSAYALFVPRRPLRPAGFYSFYDAVIIPGDTRYYRFISYRNDTIFDSPGDYFVTDDEFISDTIRMLEFPFSYQAGDTGMIEVYTLTESMYNYYQEFISLLFNDGGLFSPPPVNPESNIVNLSEPDLDPYGYFQVSAVSRNSFLIPQE